MMGDAKRFEALPNLLRDHHQLLPGSSLPIVAIFILKKSMALPEE
jgi:hypothetical protein